MEFTKISDFQYKCDITTELKLTLTERVEQPYADDAHFYIITLEKRHAPNASYETVAITNVVKRLTMDEMLQGESINTILEELDEKINYYATIKQDVKMHTIIESAETPKCHQKTIVIMNGSDYLMTETGETVIFDTIEDAKECQSKTGGEIKECILFCDKKINWKDIKGTLED